MTICGEADDVSSALKQVWECRPDLAIVDVSLRNSDGLDFLKALPPEFKQVRVIVHSMYDASVYANRCIRNGALGYVSKEADPHDVIVAIREALAGRIFLSPQVAINLPAGPPTKGTDFDPIELLTDRQLEILRLIGTGMSPTRIARKLGISVHTVESHRDNIRHKLELDSASEVTRFATLWESRTC
jgi:DNA-binding NarL/FixJ family response regulator